MSFRILAGLILANTIWSANPVMSKFILADFAPAHAAWLRYASALAAYLIAVLFFGRRFVAVPKTVKNWGLLVALGFFTFCFSPLLAMTGLSESRATDGALLTAMEPLITMLMACLFLGERLHFRHAVSFGVALSGFALLSGVTPARLAGAIDSHLMGNLIMLGALTGEAAYSIGGRKLLDTFRPAPIFGSGLVLGVGLLSIATFLHSGLPAFSHMTLRSFFAVMWVGPLGTTAAYLYWMFAMTEAPVTSIALTLFIQPILGSFWGFAFLGERLSVVQATGGALIVLAVLGQTLAENRASRS